MNKHFLLSAVLLFLSSIHCIPLLGSIEAPIAELEAVESRLWILLQNYLGIESLEGLPADLNDFTDMMEEVARETFVAGVLSTQEDEDRSKALLKACENALATIHPETTAYVGIIEKIRQCHFYTSEALLSPSDFYHKYSTTEISIMIQRMQALGYADSYCA